MEARAWRLAGGAAAALLVMVALVAWRADSLSGGWLLALRLTGVLAVVGLLAAVVLASLTALHPPTPASVVVRVPTSGAPSAAAQAARAALVPLRAVLLLAVLAAAPVLVVLVLATSPDAEADADLAAASPAEPSPQGGTATESPTSPVTESPTSPVTESPTSPVTESPTSPVTESPTSPAVEPSPSDGGAPSAPADPAPEVAPAPPPSPAQLPSEAAARAVCEQVVVSGDSLWSVAAAQLGPEASDADVDARWRAIYDRNAQAVGPDPDLVRPGLQLRTCA